MKWFEGSIADAVSASKAKNAIFVVYIEGPDAMSKTMNTALDSGGVSSHLASSRFVCIKLTKDSESHKQFTEIYKIVPVPSLFFIGENGVPLEIVASDKSLDNVSKKIISAISKIKGEPIESLGNSGAGLNMEKIEPVKSDANTPSSSAEPKPSSSDATIFSETVVKESESSKFIQAEEPASNEDKPPEMDKIQELIKKKREENQTQEDEKEKERELSRRKMGKEIAQARKSQQEKELEAMRKERENDKKLEAEARQRVLKQIEEDKANRAARMASQQPAQPKPSTEQSPPVQRPQANECRIQFKLPDGQTRTQAFPSNTTLRDLRSYIDSNIQIPFKEYLLATTFPRREFTNRDLNRDLAYLELLPSSVVLILPVHGNMALLPGGGWTAAITAMFWTLIQPMLDFGSYLRSVFAGRRDEPSTSSSQFVESESESSSPRDPTLQQARTPYYAQQLGGNRNVRKRGNIHTLSDGNDSNDENNTWNGNSTQLM